MERKAYLYRRSGVASLSSGCNIIFQIYLSE